MGSPYLRPPRVVAAAEAGAQNPVAAAGAQNPVSAAEAEGPAAAAPHGDAVQQDQGVMAQTWPPMAKR